VAEKDSIKYRGNKVPSFLVLVWSLFGIFAVAYMALYAWPDLLAWLKLL